MSNRKFPYPQNLLYAIPLYQTPSWPINMDRHWLTCSATLTLSFQKYHINEIIHCMTWHWIIWFNLMPLRFIQMFSINQHFLEIKVALHYKDLLFVHSFTEELLHFFHFYAIMHIVAIFIYVHILNEHIFLFFYCYLLLWLGALTHFFPWLMDQASRKSGRAWI